MPAPLLDDDLGFLQRVEDFPVEQLVAEPCIEDFTVTGLPGRTGIDIASLRPVCGYPVANNSGDELRTGVDPDEGWRSSQDDLITVLGLRLLSGGR